MTIIDKIHDNRVSSVSHVLYADNLGDVGIGLWTGWQPTKERGDLIVVLDATEPHRRRLCVLVPDWIERNLQGEFTPRPKREALDMAVMEVVLEGTKLHARSRLTRTR